MGHWWNGTDRGKQNFGRKSCSGATFSTTNPILTGLGMNLASAIMGQ